MSEVTELEALKKELAGKLSVILDEADKLYPKQPAKRQF